MEDKYRTDMWVIDKKAHRYWFQTTDPEVHKRMRQRKDFKMVGRALNASLWIYSSSFYSPKEARRTLRRITRSEIKYDEVEELYYTETGAIVACKNESRSRKDPNECPVQYVYGN